MGASFGPGIYSLAIKYLSLFCILYLVLANASAICWQVGCIFFSWRLKQELQVGGLDIRPLALYVVPWLCSRALPHSSLPGARVRTPFCKGTRGMRHPIVPICPATKSHGWWWSRIDQPVLREPLSHRGRISSEYPYPWEGSELLAVLRLAKHRLDRVASSGSPSSSCSCTAALFGAISLFPVD